MWNLARFAEALGAAGIPVDQSKADLTEVYMPTYEAHYLTRLRPKVCTGCVLARCNGRRLTTRRTIAPCHSWA